MTYRHKDTNWSQLRFALCRRAWGSPRVGFSPEVLMGSGSCLWRISFLCVQLVTGAIPTWTKWEGGAKHPVLKHAQSGLEKLGNFMVTDKAPKLKFSHSWWVSETTNEVIIHCFYQIQEGFNHWSLQIDSLCFLHLAASGVTHRCKRKTSCMSCFVWNMVCSMP